MHLCLQFATGFPLIWEPATPMRYQRALTRQMRDRSSRFATFRHSDELGRRAGGETMRTLKVEDWWYCRDAGPRRRLLPRATAQPQHVTGLLRKGRYLFYHSECEGKSRPAICLVKAARWQQFELRWSSLRAALAHFSMPRGLIIHSDLMRKRFPVRHHWFRLFPPIICAIVTLCATHHTY